MNIINNKVKKWYEERIEQVQKQIEEFDFINELEKQLNEQNKN